MIVLQHDFKKVIKVSQEGEILVWDSKQSIGQNMYALAQKFPNEIMCWSHVDVFETISWEYLKKTADSNRTMQSYNPYKNYLSDVIGYVEESPFIKINKKVKYPTWQMSSVVGCMATNTIIQTDQEFWKESDFDYCLNEVAKTYQPFGLFCYSDSNLLQTTVKLVSPHASLGQIFRFVKQHYKGVWVYLLFLNLFLYERKIPLGSLLKTFFAKRKKTHTQELVFKNSDKKQNSSRETIDVIVPTIGRTKYLYDVLCDLKVQTHLPIQVIIVEQNPLPDSKSELDFIENEDWPFKIQHIFTHQSGACNARNLALREVKSKWVFLADDDIRFGSDLIQETFEKLNAYNFEAISLNCMQPNQVSTFNTIFQWGAFGSGCSVVSSDIIKDCEFNKSYEFGFGEDVDFGMQLRNKGCDILYVPKPQIIHLKAPIGGFRTKFVHPWETETIQPKPSPTVMLYKKEHLTLQQVLGYKTILFLKYYHVQQIKNPFRYYKHFQKQWSKSIFWANELKGIK